VKKAYISPPSGVLEITVVRSLEPYCLLQLDLGIPNFTVFSLKMPIVQKQIVDQTAIIAEALGALLDEMAAFMLSLNYDEQVIVRIYALVLATFQEMTPEAKTGDQGVAEDNTVVTYEGTFPMPEEFVNETQKKVITAAAVIKRLPNQRRIEFTVMKPNKVTENDVEKVIRQYRGKTLRTQPKPMYVIVYDQKGRPTGTLNLGPNFRHNLLKKVNG
jgi:hypothetical protein